MKRIYLDCRKPCPSNVRPNMQIISSLLKKRKKLFSGNNFFLSLVCLCLSSRSHSSSPSWNIVVVEKMRFFSSHSFLLFLPTTIALPLPETRSSAADIARRTNYNFARTYKLVFAPNLPVPGGKRAPIISLRWKEQIRRDKEPFPTTINSNSNQTFFSTVGKHLYQLVSRNVDFWQRLKSNSRNFTSVVLCQADTWEDCSKPGAISRAGARYSPSQLKLFTWRYSELMRT